MRRYACVVVSSGMRRETVQPASKREIGRERERERVSDGCPALNKVVSLGRDKGILEVRGRARSITCTVSMQVLRVVLSGGTEDTTDEKK